MAHEHHSHIYFYEELLNIAYCDNITPNQVNQVNLDSDYVIVLNLDFPDYGITVIAIYKILPNPPLRKEGISVATRLF